MTAKDYYQILGVKRDASAEEIKKAFRHLAIKLHPDKVPSHEKKQKEAEFKELNEAYTILSDPTKRSRYDAGESLDGSQQFNGQDFGDVFGDFGNIFGDIFGGRRSGSQSTQRNQRGADLRYRLTLNLEDVIFGYESSIKVPRLGCCQRCQGSGATPGTQSATCTTCHGAGQVYLQHGMFSIQQTCPDCRGEGQRISSPCAVCRGSGQVKENATVAVKIPAGVDDGDQIRLAKEGEAGFRGGGQGDLYVQVQVKPHHLFKRKEYDLYGEMPISYSTAILGGEVEIPTINGLVRVHVPKGTPNSKVFKLRGKGVTKVNGYGHGDLFLTVTIEIPVKLTSHQLDTIKTFENSLLKSDHHYPKMAQWLQHIKQFFTKRGSS